MTNTEIDIMEIKSTLKEMQAQIDLIAKYYNTRSYYCQDLVPSTQAYNPEYDRE